MVIVGERRVAAIVTARLVLEPVTQQLAQAVLTGCLTDVRAGQGWPHADTADAMALALTLDAGPGWVISLDHVVIGDCGAFAWPDERGVVEIGYGLAEPFRRRGYATEAVGAMCRWLHVEAGAETITATRVGAGNAASRRVLEKLGFVQFDPDVLHVSYRLTGPGVRMPSPSSGPGTAH